jgi:hypothetical protein
MTMAKRRTMPPGTPRPPERDDPDVTEALDLVDQIVDAVDDDVPSRAKEKHADFFESVVEKAKGIGETVRGRGEVTPGQLKALNNMLAGVVKWTPRGRED